MRTEQKRIVVRVEVLPAKADRLKRLQAQTAAHENLKSRKLKAEMGPAILRSSSGFDPTGDRAFKGELWIFHSHRPRQMSDTWNPMNS